MTLAFGPIIEGLSGVVEASGVPTLASAELPLEGSLILKDTPPEEPLGVPGEVHTYPTKNWWRQLWDPFRTSPLRAITLRPGGLCVGVTIYVRDPHILRYRPGASNPAR